MVVEVRTPPIEEGTLPERTPRASRRVPLLLGALVAAWAVPALLHLLRLDVVAALLIWAGTAAALRCGATILDRLMVAAGLLLGLAVTGGLLFSVWPWGLHPVPIAGLALTGLVAAAALGRPPRLPGRIADLSDAAIVAASLVVTALMIRPMLGGSTARMSVLGRGEDGARHFALFDHIKRFDGYVYFHTDETATGLQSGFESYPQGTHMVMALVENFVRSTTSLGDPLTRFDDFAFMYAATFVFATACLMWAARHVLGPGHRQFTYLPFGALVVGYFYFGDGIPIFIHGFVSEIAAIGPYALLIAVLARPLRDMREQIVVVAALVVAVSMIYYLFLITVVPVMLVWLLARRRELLRRWRWTVPALVVGGVLTAAAPLLNIAQANRAEQLTSNGGIEQVNRNLLTVLVLAVAAGLLTTRTGRRSPVWRMMTVWFVATVGYAAALYVYSVVIVGQSQYYYEKALHQVIIFGLVGIGAVGLLVPRYLTGGAILRRGVARRRRYSTRAVSGVTAAILALTAMVLFTSPYVASFGQPPEGMSWGQAHAQRRLAIHTTGDTVVEAFRKVPADTGQRMVNVVYVEGVFAEFTNYTGTLWISVLSGDNGIAWQEPLHVLTVKSPEALEQWIRNNPEPLRFLTNSTMVTDTVARLKAADPSLRVEAVAITHRRA